MKSVMVNGTAYQLQELRDGKKLTGYTVHAGVMQIGNRIERIQPKGGAPHFRAIARNELGMGLKDTLAEAVADVVREGKRDVRP